LPDAGYRVQLDAGDEAVAYRAGKTHIQRVGNGAPDFELAADAAARRLPTLPLCLKHNETADSVHPLPLVGRGWGWGSFSGSPHDPHPGASRRPSPQGGGQDRVRRSC